MIGKSISHVAVLAIPLLIASLAIAGAAEPNPAGTPKNSQTAPPPAPGDKDGERPGGGDRRVPNSGKQSTPKEPMSKPNEDHIVGEELC